MRESVQSPHIHTFRQRRHAGFFRNAINQHGALRALAICTKKPLRRAIFMMMGKYMMPRCDERRCNRFPFEPCNLVPVEIKADLAAIFPGLKNWMIFDAIHNRFKPMRESEICQEKSLFSTICYDMQDYSRAMHIHSSFLAQAQKLPNAAPHRPLDRHTLLVNYKSGQRYEHY